MDDKNAEKQLEKRGKGLLGKQVELDKQYVFSATGNLLISTTVLENGLIQKRARDIFNQVSVFFAGMTKACASQNKSIYDYDALQKIINSSGNFVHMSEMDFTHNSTKFGMEFSKEILVACLGLGISGGASLMSFAQSMVSSVGKEGLRISGSSEHQSKKACNILFVLEYLLGMPMVTAMVITVEMNENKQAVEIGPCFKESSVQTSFKLHKDLYMFVTPQFITEWSDDIVDGMNNEDYNEMVNKFCEFLSDDKPSSSENAQEKE